MLDNVVLQRLGLNGQLDRSQVTGETVVGLCLLVGCVLALVGLAFRRRERADVATAVLALLLLPQALQRIDHWHLTMAACVVLPLTLAPAVAGCRGRLPLGIRTVATATAALAVAMALSFARVAPPVVEVSHAGRAVFVTTGQAPLLEAYLDTVTDHVEPGSRLFVGALDMSVPVANLIVLYHLLPEYRVHAYYVEIPDGVANVAGGGLAEDVARADALVLTERPPDLFLVIPPTGRGTDEADRLARSRFCQASALPEGVLLLRRGRC